MILCVMLTLYNDIKEHEYNVAVATRKDLFIAALVSCICRSNDKINLYDRIIKMLIKLGVLQKNILNQKYDVIKQQISENIMLLCKNETHLMSNIFLEDKIPSLPGTIYKNYIIDREINCGSNGKIYRVKHTIDQNYYAIKRTKYSSKQKWNTEIMALSKLRHDNVVGYYNSWIDYDFDSKTNKLYLYTQLELCDNDLESWLKTVPEESKKQQWKNIFLKIIKGIEHIHSKHIIHRDIKPSNILLNVNTDDKHQVEEVKITDFGNAKIFDNFSDYSYPSSDEIGTEFYAAPELLSMSNYDTSIDIYSLGIILIELSNSFKTKMEELKYIKDIHNNIFNCAESNLISRCISFRKEDRPTIKEIKSFYL